MTGSRGSPWTWLPLGVALCFSAVWLLSRSSALRLELPLFLPLFAAWLTSRFGRSALGPLLVLGLLAALEANLALTPRLALRVGIEPWVFLLGACAAVVFSRPRLAESSATLLGDRWRRVRWLVPVALWLLVFRDWTPRWEITDTLTLGLLPALSVLVAALAFGVDRSEATAVLRSLLPSRARRLYRAAALALLASIGLALVLSLTYRLDYGSVGFGFVTSSHDAGLVYLLAFALPASGLIDWRLTALLVLVFFASEPVVTWGLEAGETLLRPQPEAAASAISELSNREATRFARQIRPGLMHGLCATILAAALAPFWQTRSPPVFTTRRAGGLLLLALAVLFAGLPAGQFAVERAGLLLAGGTAFTAGLAWRFRGLVAGPLVIQSSFLLSLVLSAADERSGASALELVNLGFHTFPYAFFGLLSNRYAPPDGGTSDNSLEPRSTR